MRLPGIRSVVARNEQRPGRRTVLIYGHYDVQPPDPLDLWETPPFEPVIKGNKIFARGSTDNKGQILAHILGVESALKEQGDLPVNLVLMVEGEEEIGSPNLEAFLQEHKSDWNADVVAISDTGMVAPGIPTFTYGLRGILCMEIRLRGPSADLHSGIFGGSVANPATVLSRIVAKLHDDSGRDRHSRVLRSRPSAGAVGAGSLGQTSLHRKSLARDHRLAAHFRRRGIHFLEQVWARPTAEVNGFGSGYQGEGPKTISPEQGDGQTFISPCARSGSRPN